MCVLLSKCVYCILSPVQPLTLGFSRVWIGPKGVEILVADISGFEFLFLETKCFVIQICILLRLLGFVYLAASQSGKRAFCLGILSRIA